MGGVTISTAGNKAQFGITAVQTGIISDRLASSGRSFSLQFNHTLHKNICKQKTCLNVKAEYQSQKIQSSPIFSVSNSIYTIENQESISSKKKSGNKKTRKSSRVKNAALDKDSTCTIPSTDIDYGKAAETLEHIYNDSPSVSISDFETSEKIGKTKPKSRKTKMLDLDAANDKETPAFPSESNFETSDKIGKTKRKRRKTKDLDISAASYKESPTLPSDPNSQTVGKIGKSKAKVRETKRLDLNAETSNHTPAFPSGLNFETSDRNIKAETKRKSIFEALDRNRNIETGRKRNKGLDMNAGNEIAPIDFVTDGISNSIEPSKVEMVPVTIKNQTACIARGSKKGKKRLSLPSRIALTKSKLDRILKKDQTDNQKDKKVNLTNGEPDLWSEEVDDLIKSYAMASMSIIWHQGEFPELLSPAEHKWLANLMKPMKFYIRVQGSLKKVLRRDSREREIAAALNIPFRTVRRYMEAGRAARNKLILHNLRLVLFEIKKYNVKASNIDFEDACAEGMKGLMIAVDKFDPDKGFRLSTYAMYWIRHAILRAMALTNVIHIPVEVSRLKLQRQRTILDLLVKLGRAPTSEEVRSAMGLSKRRYKDVITACRKVLSYDMNDRANIVPYQQQNESYTTIKPQALLRFGLDDVLDSLKPKESLVIRQRFGLDGRGKRSLGEIARNLSISREMVRKYEVKAMLKLKHPSRVEYIRGYL